MFFNWAENQNATWQLWGGPNQANLFGYHVGQGEWAGTIRGSFLPYYDEASNGRYMVHIGRALSRSQARSRPGPVPNSRRLARRPAEHTEYELRRQRQLSTDFQYIVSPRILVDLGTVDRTSRVHGHLAAEHFV